MQTENKLVTQLHCDAFCSHCYCCLIGSSGSHVPVKGFLFSTACLASLQMHQFPPSKSLLWAQENGVSSDWLAG